MSAHQEWTGTESALEAWGGAIGAAAVGGEVGLPLVLALRGELGAGKSVVARAVARGVGVAGPMPSPTYNLLFTYDGAGDVTVHHLDLYRIEDPDELWELGWRELAEGRRVVMVEWPERAESLMPADRWDVALAPVPGAPLLRRVRVRRMGDAPAIPDWSADAGEGEGDG